ncbi:hypothetical protein ACL02T_24585 [Pseudonocardia sp. RS010]|uniref:hypothetical protein n=1 Tax=Pseudonocardia sp. RS010 TaxID=3385979 RepID=UPI0039A0220F
MSNDVSPSGSRWEPLSSPHPVLSRPDQPAGTVPARERAGSEAPHPVYDITSAALQPVTPEPPARRTGLRRTVVLAAAAAGFVLAGGVGGYAIGHAAAAPPATGIDGVAGAVGSLGGPGGPGGERHHLGDPGLGGRSSTGRPS